jgi:hypothetical protein
MAIKMNLSPEETMAAFSGSAFGVNRFVTSPNGTWVRLAFLERGPDDVDHFRTAVILAPGDITSLVELLSQYIPKPEQ